MNSKKLREEGRSLCIILTDIIGECADVERYNTDIIIDQDEAIEVADEIIITNKGRIEQKGTPIEVYRNPKTAFSASFFGQPSELPDYNAFRTFEQRENIDKAFVRPEFVKVTKYQPIDQTYTVGDEIPLAGKSYSYPKSFDIIVLRDSAAVKVRQGKITQITRTHDYNYEPVPLLNGRGFELLINNRNELDEFLRLYSETDGSERDKLLAEKLRLDTYRTVAIK